MNNFITETKFMSNLALSLDLFLLSELMSKIMICFNYIFDNHIQSMMLPQKDFKKELLLKITILKHTR